jgi:hypothetical protein
MQAAGSAGSAAGSGAPVDPKGAAAPILCTVGATPCYCPDGKMSGTQFCDARRELGMCQCDTAASPTMGVRSDAMSVCEDLRGLTDCSARTFASAQVPASILFVIDRSGSMACNAPPVQSVEACNTDPHRLSATDPSRWEITVAALKDAFKSLAGSSSTLGLSMFSADGSCGVDSTPIVGLSAVDDTQLSALSMAMDSATPAGGTPIVGALVQAYHHLHEELHATGNRYVVLITDGEESCGTLGSEDDAADLLAARERLVKVEVQKARDANIRTFVIGAPGSEGARGFLSELAFLGGSARRADCAHGDPNGDAGDCHFDLSTDADFAATLRGALGKVSNEALACEFPTPPGANASTVNVQMSQDGAAPGCILHDQRQDSAADGWQFPNKTDGSMDTSRVVLRGPACDRLKSNPSTVVDIILGCAALE